MKYTKLGSSDLNVSRICMGCMGFGDPQRGQHSWTIDEAHTREIIKRGLALGVNFYDTAIAYQSGSSEQYVGRTLRDFAKREEVVVATKFLPRTAEEIENGISGQQHIENMINTSLSNLGIDRVAALAEKRGVSMTEIALAWLLTKVDSPVVGAKANALAEKEGFAKFISVQGHYNLIFREEEREMVPYCEEENIALTPYSTLASGRLSRKPGEGATKRAAEDSYAKFKYDATAQQDGVIIDRVAALAEKRGVSMTEIALAWLLTKVDSPVVGLTEDEIACLEEPYVPHPLAGVMAQNKRENAKQKHVWSTGDQTIREE